MLSTNLWELLWRCFRRGGRELGTVASTVWLFTSGCLVPGVCLLVCFNSATSSLHPQLPRVSTQSDITRHWCLLMFHILPSGPSKVVKKNSRTREAMRRHTRKTKQNKTQVQVTRASRVNGQGCSWLLAIVPSFAFNTCVGVSKVFIARQWRHLDM